jgi:glycosyltransferase involved in cell wall biosynthesis
MHVAWITESAHPVGGAERYVLDTATLLRARGFRSSLLYGVPGWTDPAFTRAFDRAHPMVDVPRQVQALAPDLLFVHVLKGPRVLRQLVDSGVPCVRFFHDHHLFCLRDHKYTTIRQRTCTRTVGAACYPCLGFVNRSAAWPGVRLRTVSGVLAEQREHARLAGYVVASRYMADHVAAHGFDRSRIHVIPLGVPGPAPRPAVARERGLLLAPGALVRGKGIDVLLDALRSVAEPWRLVLAGTGRQEHELRQRSLRHGLLTRVTFAGKVSRPELEELYARAHAVVLPSRTPETFGLVGPEAMSFATPVIATRVGGVGEWLEDGVTGLAVPPTDAEALAAAVSRILSDEALARRLGETGFDRWRDRFQPGRHADALATVLRAAAGGLRG